MYFFFNLSGILIFIELTYSINASEHASQIRKRIKKGARLVLTAAEWSRLQLKFIP